MPNAYAYAYAYAYAFKSLFQPLGKRRGFNLLARSHSVYKFIPTAKCL